MAHDISVSALRSERMSPSGPALAVLLHVAVVALLWWLSVHQPHPPPPDELIEVTFEQPKPPKPKAPEPPPPTPPKQAAPTVVPTPPGLRPPAPIT
ncbi:MAG: cell envelope integrity protein TolA, partial [Proteobacteria bacterium]|nr:cell envelope integrity protein TolA [Pseudomonadota bacterium]